MATTHCHWKGKPREHGNLVTSPAKKRIGGPPGKWLSNGRPFASPGRADEGIVDHSVILAQIALWWDIVWEISAW